MASYIPLSSPLTLRSDIAHVLGSNALVPACELLLPLVMALPIAAVHSKPISCRIQLIPWALDNEYNLHADDLQLLHRGSSNSTGHTKLCC